MPICLGYVVSTTREERLDLESGKVGVVEEGGGVWVPASAGITADGEGVKPPARGVAIRLRPSVPEPPARRRSSSWDFSNSATRCETVSTADSSFVWPNEMAFKASFTSSKPDAMMSTGGGGSDAISDGPSTTTSKG
jgi:hypothetical protein